MNDRRITDADLMAPLGRMVATGLASALATYESREPRCRPCIGAQCYSMSEADSPYCPRHRMLNAQRVAR